MMITLSAAALLDDDVGAPVIVGSVVDGSVIIAAAAVGIWVGGSDVFGISVSDAVGAGVGKAEGSGVFARMLTR